MTRLQKGLSKIRTIKELANILGVTEHFIVCEIAITPDNELIRCDRSNCSNCSMHGDSCYMSSREYLNAEIQEAKTNNCSSEIIEMRENARIALLAFLKKQILTNGDVDQTGLIISHNIALLEKIGLFEHNELRKEFIEYLEKLA